MLQSLDMHWKDHLAAMDHLRQGIHLRGYAQKNPKQEYKREAFELFADMLEALKLEVISILSKVQVRAQEEVDAIEEKRRAADAAQTKEFQHESSSTSGADPSPQQVRAATAQVGRNEPCPCGSGKKYKHCHGRI